MSEPPSLAARAAARAAAAAAASGRRAHGRLRVALGGAERTRVILALAGVLALSGADTATVGASATALRSGLGISNTDIGLLVSVTSLVGALASIPFGVLADRVKRARLLGGAIFLWAIAMFWSAAAGSFGELLLARVFLGAVTAAAGPLVASLVGDYFRATERGRIYGLILAGELLGAGFGFAIAGDISAISWRAAFVVLAFPALVLGWVVVRLPEPARGGSGALVDERLPEPPPVEDDEEGEGHKPTDAQLLARARGLEADPELAIDASRMNLIEATRHVLRVRTNVLLILSSALGYYFLAGVQTFGVEFAQHQYGVGQAVANLILVLVGGGAVLGVLFGGFSGDALVRRGHLNGRIAIAAATAAATPVLFAIALRTHSATAALPYLAAATFALSAQNPPLDAARLDIMPPLLWGRAEAIRTGLRALAQAMAPLLFGAISDYVFGGGRSGLQWTFTVMLVPLAGSAILLFRARKTYPRDVANAAAAF